MSPTVKIHFQNDLKHASSMKEVFDVFGKYYDLENCRPGIISKGVILSKLPTLVQVCNAKLKPQYQK